jgi:hypothetical protein
MTTTDSLPTCAATLASIAGPHLLEPCCSASVQPTISADVGCHLEPSLTVVTPPLVCALSDLAYGKTLMLSHTGGPVSERGKTYQMSTATSVEGMSACRNLQSTVIIEREASGRTVSVRILSAAETKTFLGERVGFVAWTASAS